MKTRFSLITALVTVLVALLAPKDAQGQNPKIVVPPPPVFAFGSDNIVADHAAKMTDQFWLDVYQVQTDGSVVFYAQPTDIRGFSDMATLNSWLRLRTSQCATNIFTTTNAFLDQQFMIRANAVDMADGFYTTAYYYQPFYLVKNGTNYSLPDFSSMTMHLESDMPYRVTNIDWAVMQVYDLSSNIVDVLDSRYEDPSTSIVDDYDGILDLPTTYVSGNYTFRLVIVSGTDNENYGVYGARGNQIPEILPTLSGNYNKTNKVMNMSVSAGDVGRYLTIQCSTNLVNWTTLTSPYITYYFGYDPGFSCSVTNSLKLGEKVFRIRADSGPF